MIENPRPNIKLNKLPEFSEWQNRFDGGREFTLMDYLYEKGTLDLAIAFTQVFWPEIILVKGCYLRAVAYYESDFDIPNKISKKDKQKMESVINHLHIYDLFSYDHPETELEVDETLGLIVRDCWTYCLKHQIPHITFKVDYKTEPDAYGPTITFWQDS